MHQKTIASKNIVLIYPKLGWMDTFITDPPLSLLYAAHECQKNGIDVRIIDQRILGDNCYKSIQSAITDDTLLVGFSVMSGSPILHALEISKYIKEHYPSIPVVWGGVHVTICPDSVLDSKYVDFIQCSVGSHSLYLLARYLFDGNVRLDEIPGLGWLDGDIRNINPYPNHLSYCRLNEIDLSLVNLSDYKRFNYSENVYSLFTSFGCPHKCRFCFSPIILKNVKGKHWIPYEAEDVIKHIVEIVQKYNIGYVSILDDNFFLDISRAKKILTGVYEKGVNVRWGIRGVRIDDLDKMDKDLLSHLAKVGVEQMMIGAESGSQRVLNMIDKRICVEQIIRVNRKLSDFQQLIPSYNFLAGIPGETIEDLYLSVDLILQLHNENKNASFSGMNQFIPFPGSELYNECIKRGYVEPEKIEEWALIDTHYNNAQIPWVSPEYENILHSIQAALMFIDNKADRELSGKNNRKYIIDWIYSIIILSSRIYRPIAQYRLKNKYFKFSYEYLLIKYAARIMAKLQQL